MSLPLPSTAVPRMHSLETYFPSIGEIVHGLKIVSLPATDVLPIVHGLSTYDVVVGGEHCDMSELTPSIFHEPGRHSNSTKSPLTGCIHRVVTVCLPSSDTDPGSQVDDT